jgi:hypothetical protein
MTFNWTPFDHTEEYRARAKARREAGGSTVRVFATHRARDNARGGNVGPGTWEHCMAEARARWQSARAEALEQFRFACHGDEWEGF